MVYPDPSPRLGDTDNNLLFKIAQILAAGAGAGVFSFNTRTGAVTLQQSDVTGALGFTPANSANVVNSFNTRQGAVTLQESDVSAVADTRYVLKAGDTMTGALAIGNGAITAVAPVLDLSQTWNNAATTFTALRISVTNTASGANSNFIQYLLGGVEVMNLSRQGVFRLFRQTELTNSGPNMTQRKRGNVGDVNGAVLNGGTTGNFFFSGWNGTAFVTGSSFFAQNEEDWTGTANGSNLIFQVTPVGTSSAVNAMIVRGTSVDITVPIRFNGVALLNPLSVYAAGTAYTLTATVAAVDFGTTDPILTINAAGTYRLRGRIMVNIIGATFAANQTVTVRLRRTNNTPTDVSNSTTVFQLPVITTAESRTVGVIELPEVFYTTATTTDTIQIFAGLSALPGAGSVTVQEASVTAIRTN